MFYIPWNRLFLWPVSLILIQSPLAIQAENRSFIWFSDIHLDPYYGTDLAVNHDGSWGGTDDGEGCGPSKASTHPYGSFGCDSPPFLVESLLEQASTKRSSTDAVTGATDLDFMIITGDFVRHGNDELLPSPMNATEDILLTVSNSIRSYFPEDFPVVPSIGNNDVTPDYYLDVDRPEVMLGMISRGLQPLLGEKNSKATSTFQQGGYFAFNVTQEITVLSLNTVIYSTNHQPAYRPPPSDDNDDDPLGQFAWLEIQLEVAVQSKRSIYIIGHVPPTIGSYRHTQLWKEPYLKRYYEIVEQRESYSKVVKAQLFGHIHTDEFRVHQDVFPIFLTSSFTPIYGSNPSYRVVTYDSDTGELLDYHVRYLDLASASLAKNTSKEDLSNVGHWQQGQSFTEAYNVPDMSLTSLQTIVGDLKNSTDTSIYWEALLTRLHVYTHGSDICDDTCRREWACTLSSMTAAQYDTCVLKSWAKKDPLLVIGILLTMAMVLFVGGYVCCRSVQQCRQRQKYESPNVEDQLNEYDEAWTVGEEELPEVS